MYTATMLYHFKEDSFDTACEIWKNEVMEHARSRAGVHQDAVPGGPPDALALGTWEDNDHARRFMETGVFKRLLGRLSDMVAASPEQKIWDLKYFAGK